MSRPIEEAGDYFCLHHSAFQQKVNGREGGYNENDGKNPCSGSSKLIINTFGLYFFMPVTLDTPGGKESRLLQKASIVFVGEELCKSRTSEEYKWKETLL